jgi:hypothetical protein
MSVLDTIHGTLEGFATTTNTNVSVGEINEVTPEQLRRRRNIQLTVSIVLVAVIIGLFYYSKTKK